LFHGCKFITSDIDAAVDMTKNGELGITYNLCNIKALTDAIIKMAKESDLENMRRYIPKAIEYGNKYFDWNKISRKLAYMLFS
jgi:glycosyltransferase involved in cell wall biosynthesis